MPMHIPFMNYLRLITLCTATLVLGTAFAHAEIKPPAPPNGIYKPTGLEAYVTLAGKRISLPLGSVRDALMREGWIVIYENRIPIKKPKWELVLERMNFLGIKGNASVSAPENLVFRNREGRPESMFFARSAFPMQIRMSGRYKWVPVTVTLRTNLDTTIKGDSFVMDSPLSISVSGVVTAKGRIRLTAERKDVVPPWR